MLRFLVLAFFLLFSTQALHIQLQGHATECFEAEGHEYSKVHLRYETISSDQSMKVTLEKIKANEVVYQDTKSSGKLEYDSQVADDFRLCFVSQKSGAQTISFSFRIREKDYVKGQQAASVDDTDKLTTVVENIRSKIYTLNDQIEFASTREKIQEHLANSTNSRVVIWSSIQLFILVVLALLQLYYLKSFFEVKSFV